MKMQPLPLANRLTRATLAFLLAFALVPLMPGAALADPADDGPADNRTADNSAAIDRFTSIFNETHAEMRQRFNETGNVDDLLTNRANDRVDATNGIAPMSRTSAPEKYDLREAGLVTPVKLQNPWGTCWSFSAIAASETSILSELGGSAPQGLDDLSELHLAWFAYTPLSQEAIDASGSANYQSQVGEGYYTVDAGGKHSLEPDVILNQGGSPPTITSVLSSGVGPVLESDAPYRNKDGSTVDDSSGAPVYYSADGGWSVDESLRFRSALQLKDVNLLPSPAGVDDDGNYRYDEDAVDAIKSELLQGRAVSINFCADQYRPGVPVVEQRYINPDTWAHYTYEKAPANHAVTIVGWDDDYAVSNFLTSAQVPGVTQPPGPGAWIVKNSWGSEAEEFPNKFDWGEKGCFYLSYHDQSITNVETLDYDMTNHDATVRGHQGDYRIIDQYDFMPSPSPMTLEYPIPASMANVFTADERQAVTAVSFETSVPNVKVTCEVYLLGEDWTSPKDGKLAATVPSETYEYGGYHLVDLPNSVIVEKGQKYAVVVTEEIVDPGESKPPYRVLFDFGINKRGWDEMAQGQFDPPTKYARGIVNREESFLVVAEEEGELALDLVDLMEGSPDTMDFDNFPVKAYANPEPAPEPGPEPGPTPGPSPEPEPGPAPEPGPGPAPEPAPAPTPAPAPAPAGATTGAPLADTGDELGLPVMITAGVAVLAAGVCVVAAVCMRRRRR